METVSIEYRFSQGQEPLGSFKLELDESTLTILPMADGEPPPWTRLEFHQCPNCPLEPETSPHCPLVVNLVRIVQRFSSIISFEAVTLEVITRERTVIQQTTAQRGVSSLMGLVIGASGCPHTDFFKPMARFHLPLATSQETVYRAAANYMLAQYFLHREGRPADLELSGLRRIYDNIHPVNVAIAHRLRAASQTDSPVNAIILLDLMTKVLPFALDASLEEVRALFLPYLRQQL